MRGDIDLDGDVDSGDESTISNDFEGLVSGYGMTGLATGGIGARGANALGTNRLLPVRAKVFDVIAGRPLTRKGSIERASLYIQFLNGSDHKQRNPEWIRAVALEPTRLYGPYESNADQEPFGPIQQRDCPGSCKAQQLAQYELVFSDYNGQDPLCGWIQVLLTRPFEADCQRSAFDIGDDSSPCAGFCDFKWIVTFANNNCPGPVVGGWWGGEIIVIPPGENQVRNFHFRLDCTADSDGTHFEIFRLVGTANDGHAFNNFRRVDASCLRCQ